MTNERFARAVRRAAAQAGRAADPAPHGPRRVDPGRDRGGRAAADRAASPSRPACATCASPAASRSIASPTARCCATARSTTSGFSRRPAMPAARSARRLPPIISSGGQPRTDQRRATACGRLSRPRFRARRDRARLDGRRRALRRARDEAELIETTAQALAEQRRSAGSRAAWSSVRARSARAPSSAIRARPTMQKTLNLKVKYRESFRPFAPSVLREDVADWFELDCRQPLHAAGRRRAQATAGAR